MFKRFILLLLVSTGLVASVQAKEVSRKDPYVMVETAAQHAFDRLKAHQQEIQKNPNLLKDIVREDLLPYVDYRYASLKVIGRNLPNVKRDQVERFMAAFKDYLVTTYAQAFTQYHDQNVRFERDSLGDDNHQRIVSVKARITEQGAPDIDITFKARLNRKTGNWGVYDMVEEGISLLSSKQAELEGLIRQKGIDAVTEMLKEKAKADITYKKSGNKAS